MFDFLRHQLRAMAGIFKRDFKIFLRYPLNALFRIIEPVLWFAPVFFMGKGFAVDGQNVGFQAYTGTGDFVSFLLLGTILSSYVSSVFWGIGFSLKNQMTTGVLESNWLTPIPRITHLVGQTLFNVLITTFNSIGVFVIMMVFFGVNFDLTSIGAAILTIVPMLISIYGFGFAFAALVMLMREANTLVDAGNFIVNTLTGANFPVTVFPRFLMVISLSLPLTYGYDAVRGLLLGTRTLLPLHQEQLILVIFMVVMVVFGAWVFIWLERYCRRLGTTGMH